MTFKIAVGVSSSAGGGEQIFTPDFLAVGRLFFFFPDCSTFMLLVGSQRRQEALLRHQILMA